ncbi:MAG: 50S ribosomal protein L20 [Oligoflexia bacterium]|nr:50S ribosomal protein L20 [Oligoflexia bacterium]
MRVKRGFAGRRRRRKLLKISEGYRGRKGNAYKLAKRAVQKALQYAYKHRRTKKREFRALWITRVNAAARMSGLSYSRLVRGMKLAGIELDRKVLAELAVNHPEQFSAVAEKAKASLT